MSEMTPFTVPREYTPLWFAMWRTNLLNVINSLIWGFAYAFSGADSLAGFACRHTE